VTRAKAVDLPQDQALDLVEGVPAGSKILKRLTPGLVAKFRLIHPDQRAGTSAEIF